MSARRTGRPRRDPSRRLSALPWPDHSLNIDIAFPYVVPQETESRVRMVDSMSISLYCWATFFIPSYESGRGGAGEGFWKSPPGDRRPELWGN